MESKKILNWSREDDSTTMVPLLSAVIRSGMFTLMKMGGDVLALFHPR